MGDRDENEVRRKLWTKKVDDGIYKERTRFWRNDFTTIVRGGKGREMRVGLVGIVKGKKF